MTLNWAIFGTGFISNKVIDGIQQSSGSALHSIVGRDPDALREFQEAHNIPHIATDVAATLANPEIDAVYIGMPNHVHHTMTIQASLAGKAVLSEKSLTTTMQDAHALIDQVRNTTFFVEGFMYLAHPIIARFMGILQDGRLGKLLSVNGFYHADIGAFVNPAGMGTLYNLGCYPVSLLQLTVQTMCGENAFEKRKMSGFGNLNGDGNICDAAVSACFEDGVLASLQSTDSYGTNFAFSVQGSEGELRFVTNPWQPVAGRGHLQWCPYEGQIEDIYVDDEFDAFYHQIKMVERRVKAEQLEADRPSPRLNDSLQVMAFLTDWEAEARNSQL